MEKNKSTGTKDSGRLKIGDAWNAITIIALSQENPLKAIAEFVENSIDARAGRVTIIRGREQGKHFLMVADDGDGVPKNPEGIPDFHYVGTHICDSIKRRLKLGGSQGIQGEFGIGLLSFWTVGEELAMSSAAHDDTIYEMRMRKGDPGYTFEHAPGQLWRSRFDSEQNIIVINNGHRDFIFASKKTKALKLRYITRLFAKEMINRNFPGLPRDQLLERLIELSLYTEEFLR